MGIEWGAKATETKILREDRDNADERFFGISCELWFAASMWLEHGHIKFSPTMDGIRRLRDEACSRRWKFRKTLQQLESKKDFKSGNQGRSCDRSDSFVMLVHPIRMHSQGLPHSLADQPGPGGPSSFIRDVSVVDGEIPYLTDEQVLS
jgi:hypothetical protein